MTVERKLQSVYFDGNTQDGYGAKVSVHRMLNNPDPANRMYAVEFDKDGNRLPPPPPEDFVAWKAKNLDRLPKRFPGDPEDAPEPDPIGKAVSNVLANLYNGPEYSKRPEASWIIPGIMMENSYTAASGRSQAGKSFCELPLALSAATGKPWLGYEVEKTGPVFWVAAEGQARIWRDVLAWCAHFGVDPETLRDRFWIYPRSARLNTDDGREAIRQIVAEIERVTGRKPMYAVFDTLRRNMRGGVSQEEPTSDVLHTVNELQAEGIAVTLIAHHGRGHTETKGLTEWEDDADQVRLYHGTVRDGSTEIEFSKIKTGEDGFRVAVKYEKVQLSDGETTLVAASAGEPKVRSDSKGETPLERVAKANTFTAALEEALRGAHKPIGASEAARGVREWMRGDGQKPPAVETIRSWLYAVRDAHRDEPEFAGAYLIHSITPLKFSHPDHQSHIVREPRVSADGLFRDQTEKGSSA